VRVGNDNRSIEVVLEGCGAALRAASTIPPLPLADAKRRFVVTIQSSSDPRVSLEAPIPASMQEFEVFSSRRVADGRTFFDINLGYFATQQEAERARGLLLRRFAQAKVTELPLLPVAAPPGVARAPTPASIAGADPSSPLGLGGVAAAVPALAAPVVPRVPVPALFPCRPKSPYPCRRSRSHSPATAGTRHTVKRGVPRCSFQDSLLGATPAAYPDDQAHWKL
jgi:hypothetical protein